MLKEESLWKITTQFREALRSGYPAAAAEFLGRFKARIDAAAQTSILEDPVGQAIVAALDAAEAAAPEVDDADLAKAYSEALRPEPAAVITAAEAMLIEPPTAVVWANRPHPDDAAVVSVGEVGILAAPGAGGKSYIVLDLALAAVGPTPPAQACGLSVRPGPVLVAGYEEGPGRLGGRIKAILARRGHSGADLTSLAFLDAPGALWAPLDRRRGAIPTNAFERLHRRAEVMKPSLVIVDTVATAAAGVDLSAAGAAVACMRSLELLSTEMETGVLVVAHDTKAARNESRGGGRPGAGAVFGSAQWYDKARGVLYLHRDENSGRLLECVKCNNGLDGWGVRLAPVGGRGGEGGQFRGFVPEPDAEGAWIADVEAHRNGTAPAGGRPTAGRARGEAGLPKGVAAEVPAP